MDGVVARRLSVEPIVMRNAQQAKKTEKLMGQVMTVMNMKGGVGKTTVCMHIGGLLGRMSIDGRHRKVLLIDYDPQYNLSQAYLRTKKYLQLESENKTCLQILQDAETDLDPYVIQSPSSQTPPTVAELAQPIYPSATGTKRLGKVDLVPSTLDLMYIALGTSTGDIKVIETRFRKFTEEARKHYDLVLIDCHPAGSILTKTSLQNSDHVLIPVAPQPYAGRGVRLMMRFIESNRIGADGPVPHILFNLVPRSGSVPSIESDIRSDAHLGPLCLIRTLKKYKAFSDPQEGYGFVWASGKSYSTQAFVDLLTLVEELVDRLKL